MKGIPKICHLTWTKGSPMSLLQSFTVDTFLKYNPDWRVIVHLVNKPTQQLGENIYVPDYVGKDYFYRVEQQKVEIHEVDLEEEGIDWKDKATMQISDILRIKYLYEVGGVYSDFDMLWLRPMTNFALIQRIGDPLDFETTACFYEGTFGHHNNSNIVSRPGGGYLKSILDAQKEQTPPYSHQAFNTDLLNKMYPTYHDVTPLFPKVMAIAYQTFYPYSIYRLDLLYDYVVMKILDSHTVMGVHWFNGHEKSQKYVSQDKYTSRCSMTKILKREGLI